MARLTLTPTAPYRLDLTAWVLRRVGINQTDRWDGTTFGRVLTVEGAPVAVGVTQVGPPRDPKLAVTTDGAALTTSGRRELKAQLRGMLGLGVDLAPFQQLARGDERLAELIRPFAGFRPPRLGSAFETLVSGIACQQISLMAGLHLLNRMAAAYGPCVGEHHGFPRPQDLAGLKAADLRPFGFSGRKAQTILDIAGEIADGKLDLEGLANVDDDTAMERLVGLKGIGRWTAHYVLLRGLGRLNVFPVDDIGGQNKMKQWLHLRKRPDHKRMTKLLAAWRPYQGLLYFYLLLDHQRRLGLHDKPSADGPAEKDPLPSA